MIVWFMVNAPLRNEFAVEMTVTDEDGRVAQVEVFAPARLHLGFLDLHGGLGRRFGSLGLTINDVGTRLRIEKARAPLASGPSAMRALRYLEHAATVFELSPAARLTIETAIPEHAGLGSGTQLGLAVAAALARLHFQELSLSALAAAAARGGRSGIGIGAFEQGGFLVDGGRDSDAAPAPIIARLPFPASWRVLLILDRARCGLHGAAEINAFAALPDFPESLADRLCRIVVMRLLPGLAREDFAAVATAVCEIQERLGNYFDDAQNGRYCSPAVGEALSWIRARGGIGVGQSSWGPTGFAFLDSAEHATTLATALRERFADVRELTFHVVEGRNRGADIAVITKEGVIAP